MAGTIYLTDDQKLEFLGRMVERAEGPELLCHTLRIPYQAFKNQIATDPDFAADVESARTAGVQVIERTARLLAETGQDLNFTFKILDRYDRLGAAKLAREDAKSARSIPTDSILMDVAIKTFDACAEFIDPEKLTLILAKIRLVVKEITDVHRELATPGGDGADRSNRTTNTQQ